MTASLWSTIHFILAFAASSGTAAGRLAEASGSKIHMKISPVPKVVQFIGDMAWKVPDERNEAARDVRRAEAAELLRTAGCVATNS